jgi:protein-disulfide isomerase
MQLIWMLILAGAAVSIVSALERHVRWIAAVCSLFGEGCRRTADFTLLRIPISWWGMAYYAALAAAASIAEPGLFWLVMAGFGFELTFVWIMVVMGAFCIFCVLNAAVVAGLVWVVFDPALAWPAAAVALLVFIVSYYLIAKENQASLSREASEKDPAGAVATVADDRPALGPSNAATVVIEFSDPFCPACRKAHQTGQAVKKAYRNRIRWIFMDFPLEMHKGAKKAAQAAHCAEAQGKFWEYQEMLYSADGEPDVDQLKSYADALGLERRQFDACLDSDAYRRQIEKDIQTGRSAGITATPTFIIGGEMISGALTLDEFKQKIDAALKSAAASSDDNSG